MKISGSVSPFLAAVAASVSVCSGFTPVVHAATHPLAFQGADVGSCDGVTYCIYNSANYNRGAVSCGHWQPEQAWEADEVWFDFRKHPDTGQPFSPDPSNCVASVINRTGHWIYLMEWQFGNVPGNPTQCRSVPPHSGVRSLKAQNSDGGYGSVAFSDETGRSCSALVADDYVP